jgi:fumarate hydratase class II
MDATPLNSWQELSGYVAQLNYILKAVKTPSSLIRSRRNCRHRLNTLLVMMLQLQKIHRNSGHPFVTAENKFEALAAHDAIVESHGALKQLAVSLNKLQMTSVC